MSISKAQRFRILERDHFSCRYCGGRAPDVVLHVDHIQPRNKGGLDLDYNLVAACSTCNLSKSDKIVLIRTPELHRGPLQDRKWTLCDGPYEGERIDNDSAIPFYWVGVPRELTPYIGGPLSPERRVLIGDEFLFMRNKPTCLLHYGMGGLPEPNCEHPIIGSYTRDPLEEDAYDPEGWGLFWYDIQQTIALLTRYWFEVAE